MTRFVYILKGHNDTYYIGKTDGNNSSISISRMNLSSKQSILTSAKRIISALAYDSTDTWYLAYDATIELHSRLNTFIYLFKQLTKCKVSKVFSEIALNQINRYHKYLKGRIRLKDSDALFDRFLEVGSVSWINSALATKIENMSNAACSACKTLVLCVYYLYRKEFMIHRGKLNETK